MSVRKVTLYSFGYKHLPLHKDHPLVMSKAQTVDCRNVRNPHFHPELRNLDGTNPRVAGYVMADPLADTIVTSVVDAPEVKTWAFGCVGGRHRSVAMVEAVATRLRAEGHEVEVVHTAL